MAVYWISGGSGSLGTALTHSLLRAGHHVRAFARSDHRLSCLEASVPADWRPRLSCLPGAVEDRRRVLRSMSGATHVIHAAALKRIDTAEYSPNEAVQTNVDGSRNVQEAILDTQTVRKAILVSTDKASAPSTLYGASKLVAERAWLASNRYRGGGDKPFVAVRYGNVWGSAGSVLPVWRDTSGPISITDPSMTRFHITMIDAVVFVLAALDQAAPGTLWIPKLPSYRLGDLAEAWGGESIVTGRRPAEKLHESMIGADESQGIVDETDSHFALDPQSTAQAGGWAYQSSSAKSRKLGVDELQEMIEQWRNP